MKIKLDGEFENNFEIIFRHISKDKISAAKNFKRELFQQIKNTPNFPYKYRKSIYFDILLDTGIDQYIGIKINHRSSRSSNHRYRYFCLCVGVSF